jgi:predicted nucleotidyltransferase component of viral defense system
MNVFDTMLARYEIKTNDDYTNGLHEVMQQIALAGLYKGGFFEHAAFYGGTCLRIFHQLNRFSEDMDFSLLQPNKNFRLEDYFAPIINEFTAFGREVVINKKEKKNISNIESAFLKDDTAIYNLQFRTERNVKIKIELDINPPLGFSTETKLLLLPYSFMTRCYTMPCLFAGKMHALMFRKWNNRVKGRDWYDFEWYVRNNIALDFTHFNERVRQFENISTEEMSHEVFKKMLKDKIANTNIELVKADVKPFIHDQSEMDIWSQAYFTELVEMIKYI